MKSLVTASYEYKMQDPTDISCIIMHEVTCCACKHKFKVKVIKPDMYCSKVCKEFVTGETGYLKQVLIGKVRHVKPEKKVAK